MFPLLAVSCGLMKPEPPKKAQIVMYEWEDTGEGGPLKIRIDLKEQKAAYFRGERQVGWSLVSTGRKGHSTPAGHFKITEKMPFKVSNRYGWIADAEGKVAVPSAKPSTPVPSGYEYRGAEMHHWMRITSYGIGLHAGEITEPGTPLSHGCIRLPKDFVAKLYEVTPIGTPVQIVH
jgi:lipoprotein-anchoring transpeptidase ErfK/SrfK